MGSLKENKCISLLVESADLGAIYEINNKMSIIGQEKEHQPHLFIDPLIWGAIISVIDEKQRKLGTSALVASFMQPESMGCHLQVLLTLNGNYIFKQI